MISHRKRSVADSNRCTRFCRPLPNRSANRPLSLQILECKYITFIIKLQVENDFFIKIVLKKLIFYFAEKLISFNIFIINKLRFVVLKIKNDGIMALNHYSLIFYFNDAKFLINPSIFAPFTLRK